MKDAGGKKEEEAQQRLERPILTRGCWVGNQSHTQSYTWSAVGAVAMGGGECGVTLPVRSALLQKKNLAMCLGLELL